MTIITICLLIINFLIVIYATPGDLICNKGEELATEFARRPFAHCPARGSEEEELPPCTFRDQAWGSGLSGVFASPNS